MSEIKPGTVERLTVTSDEVEIEDDESREPYTGPAIDVPPPSKPSGQPAT